MSNGFRELTAALSVEFCKVRRSKTLWVSVLAFVFITIICGFFMFILEDPERARSLGLLGVKAQMFGGTADWPSFFSLVLVIVSVGGLALFGLIFIWMFGREFSDKTVFDLLSLPTSRITIVTAKIITGVCWSMALVVLVFILMMISGTILNLPGGSTEVILDGLKTLLVAGFMTVILSIPFGLAASVTRGYLPAVGCIFLVIMLDQVIDRLGYGPYFPWDIPTLYSGAGEALTGAVPEPLGIVSYLLVVLVGVASILVLNYWWKNADQT
ncbi:MAG: ABC transporter permease [Dehalococcoidales bacterium]|nr:ABC transporter permease [Dehalococcoidales bacterium]